METDADGDLIVKGVATDGSVDSDYQIVDPEWSAKALGDWLSTGGNVRMAHDAHRPVGKGLSVEIDRDGDGKHWVKSVIVDSEAKRLVEKGVLRAYSVGISHPVIKRDPTGRARGGIICGGELSELSIVDRPANKNSYLELAKAAGANGSIEFTGVLHEGAPEDVVKKAVGTFSPGDLAKLLEHRRVAEKRDMDPDVGGGVDRDKIPASDFVDPKGRRFPIVTSGDVSDAVSSYGRAKPQIPMDKFKSRLTSIARRKGFESSLPESWGNGDAKKGALMAQPPMGSAQAPQPQPPQHSGPPVPAQGHPAPPAGPQTHPATLAPSPPHGGPQDGTAPHPQPQMQDPNQPPAFKCDCPCGYEADSHMNFCPGCGSPIDKGGMGMGGQPQPPAGGQPPADPTDANGHMQVTMPMQQKADAPPSKTVGEPLERTDVPESVADAKKKPKKQGKPKSLMAETEAYAKKPKKNGKIPTPKGVPTPDGLPATKSSVEMDYAMQTAMVLKQLDVPSDLGALHDLLCPGFHPIDAEKCHPTHSLKSVDVSFWQNEALNAATGAPLVEAARATERWQAAETIKSAAADRPDEILDIRHEAHKAFKDAQIGPGTAPTPTQIRAGQFKRPNLTAGHGRPSNGHDSPNTAEVPSDGIAAADFRGGYLDSQHADESPSNKSQRPINYPTSTGNLQTVDYANASRQAAKSAMDAIHDHISHTFPDLCPMGSPGGTEDLGHVPMGETKVPQPVGDRAKKSEGTGTEKSVTTEPAGSDVLEMLGGMAAELRTLTKSLNKERKRNAELQKTVDSMAAMPDPTVTAFKGVFFDRTVNKSAVPARAVADAAEQTQQMMMRELESQFRTSHDPAQREAAWASLMKMRGLS
jgi:hypothetical protein